MSRRVFYCFVALLLTTGSVLAQSPDNRWGIGIYGGANQYSGDFGNGFYRFNQSFYGFAGLSVARNLTEHWDVELNSTYGDIGHVENRDNVKNMFLSEMFQFNFVAKYNFFKYDNVKLRPFVFAGVGYASFDAKRYDRKYDNFTIPVGAGLNFKVSPRMSVVIKETFLFPDGDNIELVNNGPKDAYLQHSIGLVFNLGRRKDRDKDGVPDRRDFCPDLFGIKKNGGCPPDSDGDGVYDKDDKCPGEKGLKTLGGCPDTDGDGVADKDDRCPKQKGSVATYGCPDTDGDGIPDKDDKCPNVAGPRGNNGCPLKKEVDLQEQVSKPEVRKYTIVFPVGLTGMPIQSHNVVDEVIAYLKSNPNTRLIIEGHADKSGNEAANGILSKKRADTVKEYMLERGVDAVQLTVVGKGTSKPVADNNTSEGRAKNRRVELYLK